MKTSTMKNYRIRVEEPEGGSKRVLLVVLVGASGSSTSR